MGGHPCRRTGRRAVSEQGRRRVGVRGRVAAALGGGSHMAPNDGIRARASPRGRQVLAWPRAPWRRGADRRNHIPTHRVPSTNVLQPQTSCGAHPRTELTPSRNSRRLFPVHTAHLTLTPRGRHEDPVGTFLYVS